MRPGTLHLGLACLVTALGFVGASSCSLEPNKGEAATGAPAAASPAAPAAADTPDLPNTLATPDVGASPEPEAPPELCGAEACPKGTVCADVLEIDCDPKEGGASCDELCIPEKCKVAARTYRSRKPSTCADMAFSCDLGLQYFGDDCGCGCFKY